MSKRERIEALESRVAALEASNSPGGLGDAPDNTPGGECWSCDATTCPCADPEPVPQWRALVDEVGLGTYVYPLAAVLRDVAYLAGGGLYERNVLAHTVAVAEGQVGDGWKADPGRVPHGHWGIAWLLAPLSHEPPNWPVVADRSAAWLRSLTDGAS